MELLLDVRWAPIIIGAVTAFVIGWLWYSEMLFAKKWKQGIGTPSVASYPMLYPMLAQAVGTFLFAWFIGIAQAANSLALIVLVTLAIVALIKANGFFVGKSIYAIAVEVGYVVVMAAIVVLAHLMF